MSLYIKTQSMVSPLLIHPDRISLWHRVFSSSSFIIPILFTPHNVQGHLPTTASQNVDLCVPPPLSSSLYYYPSPSLLTSDIMVHNKVLNISITTSTIIPEDFYFLGYNSLSPLSIDVLEQHIASIFSVYEKASRSR